jgi:hypothetical protein
MNSSLTIHKVHTKIFSFRGEAYKLATTEIITINVPNMETTNTNSPLTTGVAVIFLCTVATILRLKLIDCKYVAEIHT